MSLAQLLLAYDADLAPREGDDEAEVIVSGLLWSKWIARARAEEAQAGKKRWQLGIIACSKSKMRLAGNEVVPARHLYTGRLFRQSLLVAERFCDRTIILSALHGVVSPDELLAAYDKKLPTTKEDLGRWAIAVDAYLPELKGLKVLCLAPKPYWAPLPNQGWAKPLEGLGIGEQKAALKKMARAA